MAQILATKTCSIYHNSNRLAVELEYYKTVVRIYILDDTKAFPLLDSFSVRRSNNREYGLLARDYAIEHNLFK